MNTSKQISIMVLVMAVLVLSCGVYTAWEPERKSRAEEWQEEVAALRGANLFVNNCRNCHGLVGQGLIGPALDRPNLRPEDPAQVKTAHDYFINILTCGRVGTPMPAWSDKQGGTLNEAQLEQLATLILTGRWDLVRELSEHADEVLVDGDPNKPVVLLADISASATRITVTATSTFAQGGYIRVGLEQMRITEQPTSGSTSLTVQRAVNQSTAAAHTAGDHIYNVPAPPETPTINRQSCGQAPPEIGPPAPPPGPNEINVVNFLYNPANYQARVGDRLTWKNLDTVPHTVTSDTTDTYPRRPIDSGLFNQNQTFSYTFEVAGTFNYFCTVHPYMKGAVTVQQ